MRGCLGEYAVVAFNLVESTPMYVESATRCMQNLSSNCVDCGVAGKDIRCRNGGMHRTIHEVERVEWMIVSLDGGENGTHWDKMRSRPLQLPVSPCR